jgi:hypothetical protein
MSAETFGNLAVARPMRRPVETPAPVPRRHLEIAPSRAQRRARPRLAHAAVTIAGIGVILLVQLLLSFVLADGAYQISSLQNDQRELLREEQALNEQLELLGSTQNLTANAQALGMVVSGNPMFLNLSTGKVSGSGSKVVKLPANLVGNSLLDGSTVIDPAALAEAQAVEESSGDTGTPVVSSTPGTLPSPETH